MNSILKNRIRISKCMLYNIMDYCQTDKILAENRSTIEW